MPTADELVKAKAEELKGQKAKFKMIEKLPEGTKVKPLPSDMKKALKETFKGDFSKIKLHVGGNIKDISKEIKAKTFTIDQDMYFSKPADAKSNDLIAHELTHVVQQYGGKMPKTTKGRALFAKK